MNLPAYALQLPPVLVSHVVQKSQIQPFNQNGKPSTVQMILGATATGITVTNAMEGDIVRIIHVRSEEWLMLVQNMIVLALPYLRTWARWPLRTMHLFSHFDLMAKST